MSNILKNWKVVILSLVGATTFWFFNALNKNYDASITYPIEFMFNRDSVVVMEPLPSSVRLNVSSGGWNLLRKTFWFNLPPIEIELESPTTTRYIDRGTLFPLVVNQMSELRVNYVVSDSLFIDIEEKKSRKVALKLGKENVPLEEGFRITSDIVITPDSIELTGPKSFIDTLRDEYTLHLSRNTVDEPFDQKVVVNLPSNLITSSPEEIRVRFNVEQFYRETIQLPLEASGIPKDSSRYPATDNITLSYSVSRSLRRVFSPDEFLVFVDLSMIDKRDSTVTPILLFHPMEIRDPELDPSPIKVRHE